MNHESIESIIRSKFLIQDKLLRDDGLIEFKVEQNQSLKENFKDVVTRLKELGGTAILRKDNDDLIIYVTQSHKVTKFNSRTPIILFIATIATVSIDGYFRVANIPGVNIFSITLLYTLSLLGILGVHELGHKVASSRHGIKSSFPYFIPGLPTFLPTFGAVIKSGEPPVNRDSLFDLGISGPLAGLVVTIFVAIGGAFTAISMPERDVARRVSEGSMSELSQMDIFTSLIVKNLIPQVEGMEIILSPLSFAASLGFLVTFLNLLPAWQLDGGHIARAALSETRHRILTWITITIMFILGYGLMALLVLFFSLRAPEMTLLDNVSDLSNGRKITFILVLILAGVLYYFTIMNNPFFFPSE